MSQNYVFFENSALHVCFDSPKFHASNEWMRHVLELFWNHPSIKRIFLVRRLDNGVVVSRICVMDKDRDSQPSCTFQETEDGN